MSSSHPGVDTFRLSIERIQEEDLIYEEDEFDIFFLYSDALNFFVFFDC